MIVMGNVHLHPVFRIHY